MGRLDSPSSEGLLEAETWILGQTPGRGKLFSHGTTIWAGVDTVQSLHSWDDSL